ncbi:ATP-dependent RNA helicase HrpA [Sulfuriroseicoccus oceanibius]|uniref:RNA helicase n=1 Tax=Sulfuriroseicoccus oceanibius TaxID=2707525 RepID=A0A6B3LDX3_9BACT|nr:ATP-dependent RNA helicase HrpA [Sulfuriroseicoccus oceanibius]QQL44444.1 ATP-dependent RNA helicase HrpA [Sulfuriroseicoccus oceanibius]
MSDAQPKPLPKIVYPDLPVSLRRADIMAAMRDHQVVVVVGDTGSGKTTQLPKMALEVAAELGLNGVVGCTQPRRIAATGVASRVADELGAEVGGLVGCQVRFSDQTSKDTRVKFMTDGILLAETRGDRNLNQYSVLIIDEAHERSLNIDFLLGYIKQLLARRKDLRVVISSATLDAGGFAEFFGDAKREIAAPIIQVEGRTFPVDVHYLPPNRDSEPLAQHVGRAVTWINDVDKVGDILIFLPGEREIREAADLIAGWNLPRTDVLPLFARMGMNEQRMIFTPPKGRRRIVLATNVAETSLTIPRIVYVVDSGVARISRFRPGKGVQQLQVEPISQASARQRMGRCGRIMEGICVRLFDEEDFLGRPEFTDPEIRRSSLAGVILQMKSLRLGDIREYPFIDPPSPKAINDGRRTLCDIGALDKKTDELTEIGRKLARIPADPQLSRMLLAAERYGALPEVAVIVAGLTIMDPRERPREKKEAADKAHAQWNDERSDFLSLVHLWRDLMQFRDGRRWKMNQLRKFCGKYFLNFRRVMEWANLHHELLAVCRQAFKWHVGAVDPSREGGAGYDAVHKAMLTGVPRQIGWWDKGERAYRGAGGKLFAIFPGSGLFNTNKRHEWILGFDLVETSRLWARQCASLDPAWIEEVAPHLCRSQYYAAAWDVGQGAVYAKERVVSGGLIVVDERPVHFGRIDPAKAREIFICDGILGGGLKSRPDFLQHLDAMKDEVAALEHKLRRPGQLWSDDYVLQFFENVIPEGMCTAKAFHRWRKGLPKEDRKCLFVTLEDCVFGGVSEDEASWFPDEISCGDTSYAVYYRCEPGADDDGVTLGVHIDQLSGFPDWLPGWGVDGALAERVEILVRSLPKADRIACQPIADSVDAFVAQWLGYEKTGAIESALAAFLCERTGRLIHSSAFDFKRIPHELVTKIWVCDDEGNELAMGSDVGAIREQLADLLADRFDEQANSGWEVSGMKEWECDALPAAIAVGSGQAYPALVDEGKFVGVRVFATAGEAGASHRAGCVRLASFAHPDQVAWVRKKFPFSMNGKLMLPVMGSAPKTNQDDLMDVTIEHALGTPLPRDAEAFAAAAEKMRAGLYASAEMTSKWVDGVAEHYQVVANFIQKHRGDRHLGEVADDMAEQFEWLMRPRFIQRAGAQWFARYPAYFAAMAERIDRLQSQPIMKDLQKMDQLYPHHERWFAKVMEDVASPVWDEIGWQLQEWRVSLFSSKVTAMGKVSSKRISKALDAGGA